jgi:hypothetical protein
MNRPFKIGFVPKKTCRAQCRPTAASPDIGRGPLGFIVHANGRVIQFFKELLRLLKASRRNVLSADFDMGVVESIGAKPDCGCTFRSVTAANGIGYKVIFFVERVVIGYFVFEQCTDPH